jgi:hypothetical protein
LCSCCAALWLVGGSSPTLDVTVDDDFAPSIHNSSQPSQRAAHPSQQAGQFKLPFNAAQWWKYIIYPIMSPEHHHKGLMIVFCIQAEVLMCIDN